MKNYLIFSLFLLPFFAISQVQQVIPCPEKGITTNPDAPVNPILSLKVQALKK